MEVNQISSLCQLASQVRVITNSDLELAGTLGHNIVLSQLTYLMETTTATGTDNTPAQS